MNDRLIANALEKLIQTLQADEGSCLTDIGDVARGIESSLENIHGDLKQIVVRLDNITSVINTSTEK